MSASLVGSEMCIRDRRCVSTIVWRQQAMSGKLRHSSLQSRLLLGSAIPVSYTHLTLPTICSV
eukprot:6452082-Alexandrium_andersonii.AAC.1